MSPVLLLIFSVGLLTFALTQGYIGIYGAAVYRAENPPLYWAQVILLVAVTCFLGVIILRG
jgi:hypothetical protein